MTERQTLVDQLIRHEGLRLRPYTDTKQKITIGVGRNLSDKGISATEAMILLDHDLEEAIHDCQTFVWFKNLNDVRQRVVIDMRFNLGPTKFRGFVHMLGAIARGDYVAASVEMIDSQWAKQVGVRAARLAEMMASGLEVV